MKNDIKMVGIVCGNNKKETQAYGKSFRVVFPMFSDKEYEIYNALGDPGIPFMILATIDGRVLMTHRGLVHDFDQLLAEVRAAHKSE